MKRMTRAALCLLLARVGAPGQSAIERAPRRAAGLVNPLQGSVPARRAGAKLFARECAACHGLNRQGGRQAPPLARADIYQAAPGILFWVLRNGSLRRGMPSFAHLPEPERWQIVTFVREVMVPPAAP